MTTAAESPFSPARAGAATTTGPSRLWRFERSLGLACASAAASAPAIVGLALAVSAVALGSVVWAAAAGVAAAALLRRASRAAAFAALVPIAWSGAVLAVVEGFDDIVDHGYLAWWSWQWLVAATAATPLVIGLRLPRRMLMIVLLVAWLPPVAGIVSSPDQRALLLRTSDTAIGLGALLIAHFAARHRNDRAFLAFVLTCGQYALVNHGLTYASTTVHTIAVTMALPLAFIAGSFAADLDGGVRADAGARLVVLCQRRPWVTSLLLAFVVVGAAGPWTWEWYPVRDPFDGLSVLPLVPVAFAFLWHVGRGGRTSGDRLAPWLAANIAAAAIAYGIVAVYGSGLGLPAAIGLVMPFIVWPLVAGAILPGDPPGDTTPFAAAAFPSTIVLFPPLMAAIVHEAEIWAISAALCLLVVPLAFHSVVQCRLPTGRVVLVAVLFGVASRLMFPKFRDPDGQVAVASLWFTPAVWLVAGLLVVAARRARSMTAVPRDHPIVEDFGGE